ncbi:MAG: mechanosensitive ion channel family protein [Bacillota bacterium]
MGNLVNDVSAAITKWWTSADTGLISILTACLKLVLIIVSVYFVILLGKRVIKIIVKKRLKNEKDAGNIAKIRTIQSVATSVLKYVAIFFGVATALDALGLGVTASSLLATAGIGGLAVGFGAQSLIKDVISGAFLLFERQYVVGDTVEMASIKGVVETITLRVTHVRGFRGELIIVPNGQIVQVVNHSRGESLAVVNVELAYEQDLDAAFASIDRAGSRACADNANMLEMPKISGITNVTNSIATVRVTCRVNPSKQWEIEWLLQSYIKDQFIKDGIKPPYPHLVPVGVAGAKEEAPCD